MKNQDKTPWSVENLGHHSVFFSGPLAWHEQESSHHRSRYEKFNAEKGKICWDPRGECLVIIVDWMRDEYWGERVLMVKELAPNTMHLSWGRRQSDLIELGEPWQSLKAKAALGGLDHIEAQTLCAHLRGWCQAMEVARELTGEDLAEEKNSISRLRL